MGITLNLLSSLMQDAARCAELYDAAIEKFEAALDLRPDSIGALRLLALALRDAASIRPMGSMEQAELYEDALGIIGRALEIDPEDPQMLDLQSQCDDALDASLMMLKR